MRASEEVPKEESSSDEDRGAEKGPQPLEPMGCTQVGCGGGVVMGVSSQQLLASPLHPLTAIMNADVDIHKNKLRTFLVDSFSFQHLLHRKIIPSVFRLCGPFDFFFPSDKYFVCVCVCVHAHSHTSIQVHQVRTDLNCRFQRNELFFC